MIAGYLGTRTWLHKIPAGFKLAGLAILSVALLPVSDWHVLVAGLVMTMAIYATLGWQMLGRLSFLRAVLPILIIIGLLNAVTGDWHDGVTMIVRLLLMVMLADLVTATTTMQALMDALMPLLRPLEFVGLPARRISLAVALVIRFVPMLMSCWQAREESWRARTGRRASFRLIAPFIVETLRLTHHVAEALDARGYGATDSTGR